MPQLTIIRGLPGSGKTTLATMIVAATGAEHLEIDDYWYNENGVYDFNRDKLPDALLWHKNKWQDAIDRGVNLVVANCHYNEREINPIAEYAEERGYSVQLIECKGSFGTVHGIGQDDLDVRWNNWVQLKPARPFAKE